jgi:hypothetical protein
VIDNAAYLLQLVRLGMLLADPNELDLVEPHHFGDPIVRDVVTELKERRKTITDGGKLTNGPTLLKTLLMELGCEDGIKSVEHAKVAIRDRVEVDGDYVRAVAYLGSIVRIHVEGELLSNYEKRKFAQAVFNGMTPRIQASETEC